MSSRSMKSNMRMNKNRINYLLIVMIVILFGVSLFLLCSMNKRKEAAFLFDWLKSDKDPTTTVSPTTTASPPIPIVIKLREELIIGQPIVLNRVYLFDGNGTELDFEVVANLNLKTYNQEVVMQGETPMANRVYGSNPLHYDHDSPGYNHVPYSFHSSAVWTMGVGLNGDGDDDLPAAQIGDTLLTLNPESPVTSMRLEFEEPKYGGGFTIEYNGNSYTTEKDYGEYSAIVLFN